MGGVLTLRGRCLGLANPDGSGFSTVIWLPRARLGFDERGVYVTEGEGRFRPGEFVIGGGGSIPQATWALTRPFPEECRTSALNQFYGLGYPDPDAQPPLTPAPPPPGSAEGH